MFPIVKKLEWSHIFRFLSFKMIGSSPKKILDSKILYKGFLQKRRLCMISVKWYHNLWLLNSVNICVCLPVIVIVQIPFCANIHNFRYAWDSTKSPPHFVEFEKVLNYKLWAKHKRSFYTTLIAPEIVRADIPKKK